MHNSFFFPINRSSKKNPSLTAPSGGSNEPIFKRPIPSPSAGFLNRPSMRKLRGTRKGCSQSNVQTAIVTLYVTLGTNMCVCARAHTRAHANANTHTHTPTHKQVNTI